MRPQHGGCGDEQGDRDLKFVDAILKTLREKYKVDDRRIFATGHSNGGGFTYLLWAARGKELAAIAPVAAGAGLARLNGLTKLSKLDLSNTRVSDVGVSELRQTLPSRIR